MDDGFDCCWHVDLFIVATSKHVRINQPQKPPTPAPLLPSFVRIPTLGSDIGVRTAASDGVRNQRHHRFR